MPDLPLPAGTTKAERPPVVGLTITPARLSRTRTACMKALRVDPETACSDVASALRAQGPEATPRPFSSTPARRRQCAYAVRRADPLDEIAPVAEGIRAFDPLRQLDSAVEVEAPQVGLGAQDLGEARRSDGEAGLAVRRVQARERIGVADGTLDEP